MKVAVMQPYFLPYLGYFQLIAAADVFVVYDRIQFTKKGWIHRNRMLVNNSPQYFSLPLKKDSDYLDICDRRLADSWDAESAKLMNRVRGAYSKAPFFKDSFELIRDIIEFAEPNLHRFVLNSIEKVASYLDLSCRILSSGEANDDATLKFADRVIHICKALDADTYINPIGGLELYDRKHFEAHSLELQFLQMNSIVYQQFGPSFEPGLSILDVMMFNSPEKIRHWVDTEFTSVDPQ